MEKHQIDSSFIRKEYHSYSYYLQSFQNNDEIRITIQNQDLYVLPSKSLLYIEGFVTKENSTVSLSVNLQNNCVAQMFDEIRYELNGIEIDRTRNLGVTSEIKNYVSLNTNESESLVNAEWDATNTDYLSLLSGYFNFCVPLKILLGFAEDFDKIIANAKHDLILLRSKDDKQVLESIIASKVCKLSILNTT